MKLFRNIVGLGLLTIVYIFATSCTGNGYHAKFDRVKWNSKEDWDYLIKKN